MSEQSAEGESTHRLSTEPETPAETAQMAWRWAGASWVGLMRRNNQDSGFASPRLVGVADGMGGEAAGDLASIVATRRLWQESMREDATDTLADAVKAADADIAELVAIDPDLAGMGTTMCAAAFDGTTMSFVHIGDSRAYMWRDGELTQLTHDHSFVQQLIDQGQLTPEEAHVHPKRSLVLRIVNGSPLSRPDRFSSRPLVGDRYLFCSDGVSSFVADADIADAMGSGDLGGVVDKLLDAAEEAGAPDNTTMVLVEIVVKDDASASPSSQVWGAAETIHWPDKLEDTEADIIHQLRSWGLALNDDATVEPIPVKKKPRRLWLRRLVVAVIVVAVLAGGAIGGGFWLSGQYFIGVVAGQAAVFQGVPYRVGPWYLSAVVVTSTVNLSDLPPYYADQVQQWRIRATSVGGAEQSLGVLKSMADACIAARLDPSVAPVGEDCP